MKYKMICIDLDGTLLNSKKSISKENVEALQKAHALGVHIVIATGRMYEDAKQYWDQLNLSDPMLTLNGALLRNPSTGDVIYKKPMDITICKSLYKLFSKHQANIRVYTINQVLSRNLKSEINFGLTNDLNIREKKELILQSDEDMLTQMDLAKHNILKCEALHQNVETLDEIRRSLAKYKELEITSASPYNLETNLAGVNKGYGVDYLARQLKITPDEIIAIGDSENDYEMIQYAGVGIRMENGHPSLNDIACETTLSNDAHGVAKVVEKYILEQS